MGHFRTIRTGRSYVFTLILLAGCAGDGTRDGRVLDGGVERDSQVDPPDPCLALCMEADQICPDQVSTCLDACRQSESSEATLADCLDRDPGSCPELQECLTSIEPVEFCHQVLCPENPGGELQCFSTQKDLCEDICSYCCPEGQTSCANQGCPQAELGPPEGCPNEPPPNGGGA